MMGISWARCLSAILAVATVLGADLSIAAGEWDGNWGTPNAVFVKIKGNSVQYEVRGQSLPVKDVRVTADRIDFKVNNQPAWMTMQPDKKALLNTTFENIHRYGIVWRGSLYN